MKSVDDEFYNARIIERRDLTDDLWKIRVDPGGDFHFTAGQYATLGLVTQTKRVERPYSIVSSPYEPFVEFFVERVPHGELTQQLYKLQAGDTLGIRKAAKGRFMLDTGSSRRNHLLICTVTGVAPFISYVRTLREDWKQGRFHVEHKLFLLDGASRSVELGYREEMEAVAGEAPWLIYIPTVSRPWEDSSWKGEVGRVDDLIRKYTDLWGLTGGTTNAYLCGHPTMVENAQGILKRRGWPKDAIKEEVFFIPGGDNA